MLLADILTRDADSIFLNGWDPRVPNAASSGRSNSSITSEKPEQDKHKLTIIDIPDEVIHKILEFRFAEPKHQAHRIRLVNKRLATLALPHSLRTISVNSGEELLRLVSTPLSPLYHRSLGQHIFCFELAFITENYELVGVNTQLPLALPNLETVRLRFTLGIPTDCGQNVQTLLSEDTLCRASRTATNASWLCFLSQFQPKKFEWISNNPSKLYLVGMYRDLRSLFFSWTSLTSIYLEGICLVEQCDLTNWSLAFLTKRLHIRGMFSLSDVFFLRGLEHVKDSSRCYLLLLEAFQPETGSELGHQGESVPVVTIGATVVSLKGWNATTRQIFTDNLTRKSQPLLGTSRLQPQSKYSMKLKDLCWSFRSHVMLGLFIGVLFYAGSILDLPTYTLQNHSRFSSLSGYYSAAMQDSHYFQHNVYYEMSWLLDRFFGRAGSVYQRERRLLQTKNGLFIIGIPT